MCHGIYVRFSHGISWDQTQAVRDFFLPAEPAHWLLLHGFIGLANEKIHGWKPCYTQAQHKYKNLQVLIKGSQFH